MKDLSALTAEPSGPRLKLKVNASSETPEPAQKKLILTHNAPTQSPAPVQHTSAIPDIEPQKQPQGVARAESQEGTKPDQPNTSTQPTATPVPAQVNGTAAAKPNGTTDSVTPQPPIGNGSTMLPPSSTPAGVRVTSGSPQSQGAAASAPISAPAPTPTPAPPRPVQHKPTSIFDTRFRTKGKGLSTALLSNVSIDTHPGIKVDHKFHYDIPASPVYTQQSVTISLPQNQYYVRVSAKLSSSAKDRVAKKVCLAQNGTLRSAVNMDPESPTYDFRLSPGLNVIYVDVVAGPSRANAKPTNIGEAVDFERVTIYAHLLKN